MDEEIRIKRTTSAEYRRPEDTMQSDLNQTRRNVSEELKSRGDSIARSGMDSALNEIDSLSYAVHGAADRLHEKNDFMADWVDRVADRIDDASRYLKTHETRDVFSDVNGFAHRNPMVTIGGMFLAGLAISRFFKTGISRD